LRGLVLARTKTRKLKHAPQKARNYRLPKRQHTTNRF
jgi:hypothetical protein